MNWPRSHHAFTPVLLVSSLALAACTTVGPDFKSPAAPAVVVYTARPLPNATSSAPNQAHGQAQSFSTDQPLTPNWWTGFGSDKLNALIEEGLRASPTLEAAQARLRQAEQTYDAQAGSGQYPQLNANLGAQRTHTSNSNFGQRGQGRTYGLYNAGVSVSYLLDMFGSNRRALESLAAQADYQRYQMIGLIQQIAQRRHSGARLLKLRAQRVLIATCYRPKLKTHMGNIHLFLLRGENAGGRAQLRCILRLHHRSRHNIGRQR